MTRSLTPASTSPLAGDRLYDAFARLVRVQTKLWNDVDARLRAELSIPLTDLTALELVAGIDHARVQDIVDRQHITVGGASKVVDRLVEAGHVVRSAHPHDRRSSVLSVTAQGRRLLERAKPHLDDVLTTQLADALPSGGLAQLDLLLRSVQDGAPTNSGAGR